MNCLRGLPEPQTFTGVPVAWKENGKKKKRKKKLKENQAHYLVSLSKRVSLGILTFGLVRLVNECRQYMSVFYVEVVVRPEHIGGDDCCVAAAKLLEIRPVQRATFYCCSTRLQNK